MNHPVAVISANALSFFGTCFAFFGTHSSELQGFSAFLTGCFTIASFIVLIKQKK